jgi:hypothetical protein
MKTDRAESKTTDFRVWCEDCSIRIAPHEEKIVADGKSYHQRCYSKHAGPVAKARAASSRRANVQGGGK